MKRALIIAGLVAAAVAAVVLVQAIPELPSAQRKEAARLFALMEIEAGDLVAEIGAGKGLMTVAAARRVGPAGRVYSTELSAERREDIRAAVAEEQLANVTIVEAGPAATALPASCCDAVFMRHVYHHVDDRAAFTSSLRRSVKEGGLVGIIDFERGSFWHLTGSHGVSIGDIVETMRGAGFDEVQRVEDWNGRSFLVLFRTRAPRMTMVRCRAARHDDRRPLAEVSVRARDGAPEACGRRGGRRAAPAHRRAEGGHRRPSALLRGEAG